jgi:ribosomal protein S27E
MTPRATMDYPRDEILEKAIAAIAAYDGLQEAHVFFQVTCPACNERLTFIEPNMLYERVTCGACGHDSPVERVGFVLAVESWAALAALREQES